MDNYNPLLLLGAGSILGVVLYMLKMKFNIDSVSKAENKLKEDLAKKDISIAKNDALLEIEKEKREKLEQEAEHEKAQNLSPDQLAKFFNDFFNKK